MLDNKHAIPLILLLLSMSTISGVKALNYDFYDAGDHNLLVIKGVVEPHKSLEYRFQINVAGYAVFRIMVFNGKGAANTVSLRILLDGDEYGNYTLLSSGNELYGWGWLKQGDYVLILANKLDEEVQVYGYVLVFRIYDPRLPQLIDKEVFGLKYAQYSVGIVDYGVYIDENANQLRCYRYTAKEVIGIAYVNKVGGYSIDRLTGMVALGEFSLQLNLYVEAEATNGMRHMLWVQNIFVLKASNEALYYRIDNEVHNVSVFGKNIVNPDNIRGKGKVISFAGANVYQYYDATWRSPDKPFKPILLLLYVKIDGNRIVFAHGYFVNKDRYLYEEHDVVTLNDYRGLEIVVDGCRFMGKPIDMELVIGGRDAIYNVFVADDLDIKLALMVKSNGTWTAPLSAWSTGTATMERAYNVESTPSDTAIASLKKGFQETKQLWNVGISSKISLNQPTIYLISLRNGTTLAYLKPTGVLKDSELEDTCKVGPLLVTLIQQKKESGMPYQYVAISVAIVLLILLVTVYKPKTKNVKNRIRKFTSVSILHRLLDLLH